MADTKLRRVNKVSAKLVRTPGSLGDVNSILRHIAKTAQETFDTDTCVVLAFNPITGKFLGSQTVVGNLHVNNGLLHDKPRQSGVTQQVIEEGILFVKDLEVTPHYHNQFTRKEGIRSFVGLALLTRHRHRPLGVIYLDYRQPKAFDPDDYENFRIFATQAAFLLQETWLERHLEEVARIGQEINHNLATVEDLFQELQTYVDNVLDDSHTLMLGVLQSQTNTLDLHVRRQQETGFMNVPLQGAYQQVIETQKSWFIQELSAEAEETRLSVLEITTGTEQKESLIFVPLTLRGVSLGVLSIQHSFPKTYGKEDHFVLQLLANYIALALHNIRLYSSLTQLNETGQILTQQIESEQTLHATVEKIQDATQADIVVLFPYEPILRRFVLPPRTVGSLLDPAYPEVTTLHPGDIAVLALNHKEPIFAKDSDATYAELRGTIHSGQGNFKDREKIRSAAVVPLRVGDEVVGVLFVNFRQQQRFDSTQKLLIEGLAHYAAIAIKNSQIFGSLSLRRIRELEMLQRVDSELNRSLDLESVLNTLLRWANELVLADETSILLYNPRAQVLAAAAATGQNAEAIRKQIIPLKESKGITRWVLEHKKPVCIDNVRRDRPWRDLYLAVAGDTLSELAMPLLDGEEAIGVLNFESVREAAFRQEDQDFLHTLAGQAVLAITKAQAYEREKRLAEEGRVLNQISKEITSQLDLNHVFDLILEKALELTHSTKGNVMIYDRDRNDLWMAAGRGLAEDKKELRHDLDQGVVGYAARNKQMMNVDLSQPPWSEINLNFFPGTCSELAMPMLVGDELRGVLNVESFASNNYTERDEDLLHGLADLAVIALQNAQAFEREKRLVEEGQVLNEISKEITSQLDQVRVFDLIIEQALHLTRSSLGTLWLYDREQHILWMAAEKGVVDDRKGKRITVNQGIVGYVARNKELLMVDPTESPWNTIYLAFAFGTRSELTVPMLEGTELRGVLNIESLVPNNFNESDKRLMRGLAGLAVVALQNTERYEKARSAAQRFELLYQAGQELGKITDLAQLEQAYDIVLRIAKEQSQSLVLLRRFDKDAQELELIRASQPHYNALSLRTKLDVGINGQVARERRTIVILDIENPPADIAIPNPSNPATRSLLVTPIVFEDQYYGNLGLNHWEVGHFQNADILFFEGLAQQLASTIHRLETVQERKEFEQRAQAAEEMSSIGQSAFEVTHRLGNDLGLVNIYISDIQSELEAQGVSNGVISRKLGNIAHAVQSVLSFSGDLRQELAKLGAKDEMAGESVELSTKELLRDAQDAVSLPHNISLCFEIENDIAAAWGIQFQVADILRNLVFNAVQAMPNGGTLSLRSHNAGRYVAMEVSDTGVGIASERLPQIFDLFFSTKGSSGFGLWSARRNALRNHGELKVKSKLGEGTTFTLFLPRVERGDAS